MSLLSVAIESDNADAGVVKEQEYCQFLLINKDILTKILSDLAECRSETFFEVGLPTTYGFSRMRNYVEDKRFEFTTKIKGDTANKASVNNEHNTEIDSEQYLSLTSLSRSVILKKRIFLPISKDGVVVKKEDGSNLEWELDLFVTKDTFESAESCEFGLWVKLELEVDNTELDDVSKYIPFEYEQLIYSKTDDETEKALIDNLYNNVYNLRDKIL